MSKRNNPLNKNDALRLALQIVLFCSIVMTGLWTDKQVSSRADRVMQASEAADRIIYKMLVRNMTQGHHVAFAECTTEGVVTWENDAARALGLSRGMTFQDAVKTRQEGMDILWQMVSSSASGVNHGEAECVLKIGTTVSATYWKTPDGFIVCMVEKAVC